MMPGGPHHDQGGLLGKRPAHEQEWSGRPDLPRAGGPPPPLLHFRLLVPLRKAGSVIGKGGDFINNTKVATGAKVGVDKPFGTFEDRLVHVQGFDEAGKPVAGVQEALLRTAERIVGEEGPGGAMLMPPKCTLRLLLAKPQIGIIMGKKGAAITELRSKSGASIKLTAPTAGAPVVPPADVGDELLTIVGSPEQTMGALTMVSDRLRQVLGFGGGGIAGAGPPMAGGPPMMGGGGPPVMAGGGGPPMMGVGGPPMMGGNGPPMGGGGMPGPGMDRGPYGHGPPPMERGGIAPGGSYDPRGPGPDPKRIRGPDDPRSRGGEPGALGRRPAARPRRPARPRPRPGPPPGGNAMAMAVPPSARSVLASNDSVKTEGLLGLTTTEYRVLVPLRRSGVVLGAGGRVIKDIRARTGARLHLFDEEPGSTDRVLQVMSTEDVADPRCAAFDAAMDCITELVHDELVSEPLASVRIVLPHSQVGAIMGKGGSSIKELRAVTGAGVEIYTFPDVPRCVKQGQEVLTIRGTRDAALLATHVALVAIRGNMARGQLIYHYPPPTGAPPPTPRAPPQGGHGGGHGGHGGMGPPPGGHAPGGYGGPPGPDPRLQPHPHQQLGGPPPGGAPPPQRSRSRWDSDSPVAPQGAPPPQQQMLHQGPPGMGGPPQQQAYGDPGAQYVQQGGQQALAPQQQYMQQAPPPQQQQVVYAQPHSGYAPAPGEYGAPQQQYVVQAPAGQGQGMAAPQQQYVVQQQGLPPAGSAPMVVYAQQPQQYVEAPPQQLQQQQQPAPGGAPGLQQPGASGPGSSSGYGGLAGLVASVAAAVAPPPVPKARVLLTQDQVVRLRLDDPQQTAQLSALSGAVITLSEHMLDGGAREVLLAGSDAQCNTAKNLMEALMRSG
ncbi:hypothetical protein HT031_003806 [Scenedesmus sp. PABB004]|nr:hypothetical protein HT031_003806 [Scenedesmus sp. PABB004]